VTRRTFARRGSVAVSMLLVMLLLDLVVVGAVLGGGRDVDLSRQRIEASRALYAADTAANIALREVADNADEDGDGGIGSVSNDGNDSDDPVLGRASFAAAKAGAGPATVTAIGRCGEAQHSVVVRVP
jgi:hypothetical protein